jgi:uncharacterized membrane protein YtjA (UPF0391 family)
MAGAITEMFARGAGCCASGHVSGVNAFVAAAFRERRGVGRERWGFHMLRYALLFAIISIVAGFLGFSGISAASAGIARIFFFIAIVIFLVFLLLAVTGVKLLS